MRLSVEAGACGIVSVLGFGNYTRFAFARACIAREKAGGMEVPLLHNDALQWTVIAVPPAAPVPVHPPPPCCPAPRNVAGGATPASSSSAPASTIVWCVPCPMLLFVFIPCIAEVVTVSQLTISVS